MKKVLAAAFLCLSAMLFAQEVRLDVLKDVKVNKVNMIDRNGGWSMSDVVTTMPSDVYVELVFPKVYTVSKMVFDLGKYEVTRDGLDKKEFPGLYNFEILCMDPTYKTMKSIRAYTENTSNSLTVKEKFKTNTLRIKLNPVFPGTRSCYFGGIARLQVFGFEGEEPKKEKLKKSDIKTAEEAKQAYRDGVLTSAEYLEMLKQFKLKSSD